MTNGTADVAVLQRLRTLVRNRLGIIIPATLSQRTLRDLDNFLELRQLRWHELLVLLEEDRDPIALKDLADIFTIGHTYFFREPNHFDFLKEVVFPDLHARGVRDLRFWSAACASGEEAYSMILTMLEYYGENYWLLDAGVLATDISRAALSKAVDGVYNADGLRNIPNPLAQKWFSTQGDGRVVIDKRIRREATFRWLNLADPLPVFQLPFHVIFCRNVMLYFDEETRASAIERLSRCLAPGGWLVIGQAEDSRAARNWLEPVTGSIYRKPLER